MKIKEGFELRNICGEDIVVAHGRQNIDFSKIISLNESAAYLWRNVAGKEFDASVLAKLLTDEYEVDEATAFADAQKVMADWQEAGLAGC
ncbi:MAG: PqqD family protein [Bacteroidaceae bacterium]|nr:PqqD family protein [Bacteroidaceae bacterium]